MTRIVFRGANICNICIANHGFSNWKLSDVMKDGVESEDATTANLAIVYHSCTLDKFKEEISLPLPARRGCGNWLAGCGAVMLRGTARRPRRHLIIFVNRKLKLNSLTRCEIGLEAVGQRRQCRQSTASATFRRRALHHGYE